MRSTQARNTCCVVGPKTTGGRLQLQEGQEVLIKLGKLVSAQLWKGIYVGAAPTLKTVDSGTVVQKPKTSKRGQAKGTKEAQTQKKSKSAQDSSGVRSWHMHAYVAMAPLSASTITGMSPSCLKRLVRMPFTLLCRVCRAGLYTYSIHGLLYICAQHW